MHSQNLQAKKIENFLPLGRFKPLKKTWLVSLGFEGFFFEVRMIEKKRVSEKIWIWRALIKSEAFKKISNKSVRVLLIFFTKVQNAEVPKYIGTKKGGTEWIISNNDRIVFTYREAKEKYGINYSSFSKSISELVQNGFIDVARPGIGLARIVTLYAISERWRDYGTEKFVEKKVHKQISYRFPKKQEN